MADQITNFLAISLLLHDQPAQDRIISERALTLFSPVLLVIAGQSSLNLSAVVAYSTQQVQAAIEQ